MDLFDNDEGVPEWVAQDEDERAAEALREAAGPPSLRALLPEIKTKTLLVMMCTSSHLLMHRACEKKRMIGSILCTSVPMRGNRVRPHHQDRTCFVYALGDPTECLVLVCQARLGIVETNLLPKVLFEKIEPERVLVLDSFVGSGISNRYRSQELAPSMFSLRTRAKQGDPVRVDAGLPMLPSGILLEGALASLMAHCEAMSWDGVALVYNQPLPIPDFGQVSRWSEVLTTSDLPGLSPGVFDLKGAKAAIQEDLELLWDQSSFGKVYL